MHIYDFIDHQRTFTQSQNTASYIQQSRRSTSFWLSFSRSLDLAPSELKQLLLMPRLLNTRASSDFILTSAFPKMRQQGSQVIPRMLRVSLGSLFGKFLKLLSLQTFLLSSEIMSAYSSITPSLFTSPEQQHAMRAFLVSMMRTMLDFLSTNLWKLRDLSREKVQRRLVFSMLAIMWVLIALMRNLFSPSLLQRTLPWNRTFSSSQEYVMVRFSSYLCNFYLKVQSWLSSSSFSYFSWLIVASSWVAFLTKVYFSSLSYSTILESSVFLSINSLLSCYREANSNFKLSFSCESLVSSSFNLKLISSYSLLNFYSSRFSFSSYRIWYSKDILSLNSSLIEFYLMLESSRGYYCWRFYFLSYWQLCLLGSSYDNSCSEGFKWDTLFLDYSSMIVSGNSY